MIYALINGYDEASRALLPALQSLGNVTVLDYYDDEDRARYEAEAGFPVGFLPVLVQPHGSYTVDAPTPDPKNPNRNLPAPVKALVGPGADYVELFDFDKYTTSQIQSELAQAVAKLTDRTKLRKVV